MTGEGLFVAPTAPSGDWETLTPREKEWVAFIRVISCASDPAPTPERIRALRELLDAGPRGG